MNSVYRILDRTRQSHVNDIQPFDRVDLSGDNTPNHLNRLAAVFLAIGLASINGFASNAFAQSEAGQSRPNIVFILADRMPAIVEELHMRLTGYLDAVNATIPDPSTLAPGAGPGGGMGMGMAATQTAPPEL